MSNPFCGGDIAPGEFASVDAAHLKKPEDVMAVGVAVDGESPDPGGGRKGV